MWASRKALFSCIAKTSKLKPVDYNIDGCLHEDVDINKIPQASYDCYHLNLQYLVLSSNKTQYCIRCLETGISKPLIFSGIIDPCFMLGFQVCRIRHYALGFTQSILLSDQFMVRNDGLYTAWEQGHMDTGGNTRQCMAKAWKICCWCSIFPPKLHWTAALKHCREAYKQVQGLRGSSYTYKA